MAITERLRGFKEYGADSYIVTGSIGPQYQPVLFKKLSDARKYAKEIIKYGKANNVWPMFNVTIEWRCDGEKMQQIEKIGF